MRAFKTMLRSLVFALTCLAAQARATTVVFRITDGFGRPINSAHAVFQKARDGGKEFEGDLNTLKAILEPGSYELTLSALGFSTVRRDIVIPNGPESIITIGLCVARGHEDLSTVFKLEGRVFVDTPNRLYLKLFGVFNSEQNATTVSPSGEFALKMNCEGTYLLVVVRDDSIIATRVLTIQTTNAPLQLDLRDQPVRGQKSDTNENQPRKR